MGNYLGRGDLATTSHTCTIVVRRNQDANDRAICFSASPVGGGHTLAADPLTAIRQNWYSKPKFTPWAQKPVVQRSRLGAAGPTRVPPPNWLGLTEVSIWSATRPTVVQ